MKGGIVVNNFAKSQDMDISSRALMYDESVVHDASQVFFAHIAVLHPPLRGFVQQVKVEFIVKIRFTFKD